MLKPLFLFCFIYFGITQERFPIRVAGIHVVNNPTIFWPLLQLGISLLPGKLKSRVHLHNGLDSLTKSFPSHILPQSAEWNTEITTKLIALNVCYDSKSMNTNTDN